MPEIINEDIVAEPPVKKPVGFLASLIAGIAIGAGGGVVGTVEQQQAELESQIAASKHEICAEVAVPERVVVVDTLGTLDTIPARVEPIIRSYNSEYVTGDADTFTVQLRRGDSILYYGVMTPPAGKTPIIKTQFLDMR